MKKNMLLVIDMQNDFIDGSLGTKEAVGIVDSVKKCIEEFDGEVIYTRDTHTEDYLNTQEGKRLPVVHCVKDTYGWEICDELKEVQKETDKIIDKPSFGSLELCDYLVGKENEIDTITLVGLCTDICVISNAMILKAGLPEVTINVIASCCAGVSVESHQNALEAMKMCQIGIL